MTIALVVLVALLLIVEGLDLVLTLIHRATHKP